MIVTKKCLPRRTVLRGFGAILTLPYLDCMIPAFAQGRRGIGGPVRRFGAVYVGNGQNMGLWTPQSEGALVLSPTLKPLAGFADRMIVLSGLDNKPAIGNNGGPHARCCGSYLTGTTVKKTDGGDVRAGISMDQVMATEVGQETQLASLELSLEPVDFLGNCSAGFSCIYNNTIAWRSPTTPVPMENNPRAVFERLFGSSGSSDARTRLADIRKDRSILDSVTTNVARLERRIGPRDRIRLDEYLAAVREVERRIQKAEEQTAFERPAVEAPAGIPARFDDYAKVMFDLLALAYQCDLTRISTFLMVRENTITAYPDSGVREPYHPLSHHGNDPEKMSKQATLNTYHLKPFANFVETLQSTPDGDGSLLDHTLLLYGSGMSDSNQHSPLGVPALLVGGPTFGIKGGRHLRYSESPTLSNLHLTLLEKMGVNIDRFGDSTGELNLLSVA